jgi:benzoyl-CoA reductase/2-hydroxyglutaryl-CoA dehydratase subunit BcrC/BadD/HgdB
MSEITVNDFLRIREVNLMKIKEGKEKDLKVVGIYCTYCPQELVWLQGQHR